MLAFGPYYFGFLACVVSLFYVLPVRLRPVLLTASSLLLVGYIDVSAAYVLVFSILVNYWFGIRLTRLPMAKKRIHLWIIIALNLGLLGLFKYENGLHRAGELIGSWFAFNNPIPQLDWLLPLGLSYYTFQAIGYQVELYRGTHPAQPSIFKLATYLSFFPKLSAGPIERSDEFLPQLEHHSSFSYRNIQAGGRSILWGLFKLLFIGGFIGSVVDPIFLKHSDAEGLVILFGMMLYTVQIYAEFSGYTDIAIGGAKLFGFNLRENFNRPFFSKSLSEFWRRWHISLSSWVMEYVFKPLSLWLALRLNPGNWTASLAVFISFLILGIWHGASWNFALFGLIQGTVLAIEIATRTFRKRHGSGKVAGIFGNVVTMFVFVLSTLFFRVASADEGLQWISKAIRPIAESHLSSNLLNGPLYLGLLMSLAFLFVDHYVFKDTFEAWINKRSGAIRWLIYTLLIYTILAGPRIDIQPVIYQNF